MALPGVPAAVPTPPSRQLSFQGKGSALFGILFLNLLLSVLTLGIYYFWGKVRARQFLLGQTEFEGDRFTYHATGRELLIGWLKVAAFFLLLWGIQNGVPLVWRHPLAEATMGMLGGLIFLVVYPLAIVGSRRFRLSRTSWRGIRFSFRGRARNFWRIYVPGTILTVLTLGLYSPFFQNRVRQFLIDHSYCGTVRFHYDGRGRDIFKRFFLAVVATIAAFAAGSFATAVVLLAPLAEMGVPLSDVVAVDPTFAFMWASQRVLLILAIVLIALMVTAVVWFWFMAWRHRYMWRHTTVATVSFRSTVTAGRLFGLVSGDALRLIPTLGLAWPWVVVRHLRFTLANLFLEGPLDTEAIQQDAQAASAVGEGLASFLGFFDFDLGL